jgi:D-alanine transaminase
MASLVYLNGEFKPAEEASISILDRGFMFGDGVYEVIPVYGGNIFRMVQHLERLQRSLDAIEISNPLSAQQWEDVFTKLSKKNCPKKDSVLYLQVTRGVMEKRNHAYSRDNPATVLVMCWKHEYPKLEKDTKGVKAVTLEDTRWLDCHIKSVNLLPNVMLKQQAVDRGAAEGILIRDGYAIEGSASNLFIVKDEIIYTPPKNRFMLGGITRDLIIELCNEHKILVREKEISEDQLHDADEIWMTNSTGEILPVTTLNQHKVGKGVTGKVWQRVIGLYQAYKKEMKHAS